ncbi:MAG: glycoside hydrolase family 2 TIM barrel-domain containing protein [Clostridia bacterium]
MVYGFRVVSGACGLIITGLLHFRPYGVRVETPVITSDLAMPLAEAVILNEAPDAIEFSLYNTILRSTGEHVTTTETLYRLRAGEEVRLLDELLRIQAPKLWSTEDPQVYTLKSSIWVDGQRVDEQVATFGIREAAFTAREGFVLNGEPTLMKGVCLHHDGGLVGAAVPRRVLERRLALLKEMGCNAIRTSHNPPSPEFLDLCDRMGFLVMEELYDEWMITKPKGTQTRYGVSEFFRKRFVQDVLFTVRRDRNHPCIVIWSAGNEVPEQSEPDGILILAKLKELIAREDARPVTVGCDRIASQDGQAALPEFLALQDVIGYNYADRWGERRELASEADHVADPTRCFIGTEDSAVRMIRGEYQSGQGESIQRLSAGSGTDVEIYSDAESRSRHVSLGWDRLLGRGKLALCGVEFRADGYMRISQDGILFLSEPLDGSAHGEAIPSLELGGARGGANPRRVLYQL